MESTRPIGGQTCSITFKDLTGANTYTPPGVLVNSINNIAVDLQRAQETIVTQAGGLALIYDLLDNGVKEASGFDVEFLATDLEAGTGAEKSLMDLLMVLFNTTLLSSTAFSGWGNANPTTGASRFMVYAVLTFSNAFATGTDRVYTAAVCLTEVPVMTINGQKYTIKAKLMFPQRWTRT